MGMTLATAKEYRQGELVVVRFDLVANALPWSQFINYALGDYAKQSTTTWKALRSSKGVTPSEGADWTADPARIDPPTLSLAVQAPGFGVKVHTLISAGTILVKRGDGVYEASINTTPASGNWKAELLGSGIGQTGVPWYAKVIASPIPIPFEPSADSGSLFAALQHTITQAEINAGTALQLACSFVPRAAVAFVAGGANVSDLATCDGTNSWVTLAISDGVNASPFVNGDTIIIFAMG